MQAACGSIIRRLTVAVTLCGWSAALAFAGSAALAGDRVVAETEAGECRLLVEAATNWPALRLRAIHPRSAPCGLESAAAIEVLRVAFAGLAQAEPGRTFTSLALGRLIDYPWMARFLAESAAKDPRWDAAAGKPKGVHENRYVADMLARPEIVGPIEAVTRPHGYRVAGVSVEKVLIGGFENVPGSEGPRRRGKVPFDAQTWFRLERTP